MTHTCRPVVLECLVQMGRAGRQAGIHPRGRGLNSKTCSLGSPGGNVSFVDSGWAQKGREKWLAEPPRSLPNWAIQWSQPAVGKGWSEGRGWLMTRSVTGGGSSTRERRIGSQVSLSPNTCSLNGYSGVETINRPWIFFKQHNKDLNFHLTTADCVTITGQQTSWNPKTIKCKIRIK